MRKEDEKQYEATSVEQVLLCFWLLPKSEKRNKSIIIKQPFETFRTTHKIK